MNSVLLLLFLGLVVASVCGEGADGDAQLDGKEKPTGTTGTTDGKTTTMEEEKKDTEPTTTDGKATLEKEAQVLSEKATFTSWTGTCEKCDAGTMCVHKFTDGTCPVWDIILHVKELEERRKREGGDTTKDDEKQEPASFTAPSVDSTVFDAETRCKVVKVRSFQVDAVLTKHAVLANVIARAKRLATERQLSLDVLRGFCRVIIRVDGTLVKFAYAPADVENAITGMDVHTDGKIEPTTKPAVDGETEPTGEKMPPADEGKTSPDGTKTPSSVIRKRAQSDVFDTLVGDAIAEEDEDATVLEGQDATDAVQVEAAMEEAEIAAQNSRGARVLPAMWAAVMLALGVLFA